MRAQSIVSMEEKYLELLKKAYEMRFNSYTPYSHYKVGAALLCKNGKVYTGCNIENGAFSPTVCAERVAFFDAVKNGERDFEAIAVASGLATDTEMGYASPCGVCRQVMSEFCDDDFKIILSKAKLSDPVVTLDSNGKACKNSLPRDGYVVEIIEPKVYTLPEVLPFRFNLE